MAFLSDITLGRYVPVESVVHRLDPRAKLISALVLMTALVIARGFVPLFGIAGFLLLTVLLSRLPAGFVLRSLRPFVWLFAFTLLLHAFLTPGDPLPPFPIGGMVLTREGLKLGAFFAFRLALLILGASMMTLTTSPIDLTDGLESMLKPLRRVGFPAHELAMMMTIALRFVPTFIDEAERLRKAQLARGASFSGGLIRKTKSLIPLLVPLFLSAFRRAEQLALAMESRCYRGGEGRTSFNLLKFHPRDYVALSCVLLLSAAAVAIGVMR